MTPLPAKLDAGAPLVAWRIDARRHATSWDSGIGAEALGGRWNPKGVKAVYCSVDPSTCLVETAVHRGFKVLDSQPHVLTSLEITE
ncbi:MAG: RES domain-containing protein, partial [Luteimonas sp.]|nr:RES domain-containing protein [Luteimonas sp.]